MNRLKTTLISMNSIFIPLSVFFFSGSINEERDIAAIAFAIIFAATLISLTWIVTKGN